VNKEKMRVFDVRFNATPKDQYYGTHHMKVVEKTMEDAMASVLALHPDAQFIAINHQGVVDVIGGSTWS